MICLKRLSSLFLFCLLLAGHSDIVRASDNDPTFELHTLDKELLLPSRPQMSVATLVFRIRYDGELSYFCFIDTWRLLVSNSTGKILLDDGFRDGTKPLTREDFPVVVHGGVATLVVNLCLLDYRDHYALTCSDNFGGFHRYEPVQAGDYKVKLEFMQKTSSINSLVLDFFTKTLGWPATNLWQGSGATNSVTISIKNR